MRKVVVRDITKSPPLVLGQMIDNGADEPFGTNEAVDEMLARDRRGQFERYFAGYSNGYIEWIDAAQVG
jgi:hypothetical protein